MPHKSTTAEQPSSDVMLCFDAYAVNLAFGRCYKPLLDPLGLTYPQYLVLVVLWKADNQSVGSIGDRLGLDSSTLTPLLKRLEASELVRRKRDARDERRVIVSLTPRGAELQQQASRIRDGVSAATGLDEVERKTLHDVLHRVRTRLLQG